MHGAIGTGYRAAATVLRLTIRGGGWSRHRVPCFRDRADAGRILAAELAEFAGQSDVIVLGLPRGGVPVAYEVARALGAPLDVFLVRKLGFRATRSSRWAPLRVGHAPDQRRRHPRYRVTETEIATVIAEQERELERRERCYREGRSFPPLEGRTVILVDDGLATGASMRAAIVALREKSPARIVVAVPVHPRSATSFVSGWRTFVCAETPPTFQALGIGTRTLRRRPTNRSTISWPG